jgi:hypothetical protein
MGDRAIRQKVEAGSTVRKWEISKEKKRGGKKKKADWGNI